MSVQAQNDRLESAKAGLKATMENNGATVAAAAKLDGYNAVLSGFLQDIAGRLDELNGEVI